MDFESSDTLKFAHCSYLLLLPQDVGYLAAPLNAPLQARRAAGATQERTLDAVACKRLLGRADDVPATDCFKTCISCSAIEVTQQDHQPRPQQTSAE